MFKYRSAETELMDDLELSGEDLRKNLEELAFINKWLGGNTVVTRALNRVVKTRLPGSAPLTIADLGCGGGDILREVAIWARQRNIRVQLTGIDANAFMINYAREKCRAFDNITLVQENIFAPAFQNQEYDIIICSLFCHHFSDEHLSRMLNQLHRQARRAVIINDLHRHPLAYYSIKWLTRFFSGSYLVKNDAPLSVLRAFRKPDLLRILEQAGIRQFSLRWLWAFRWQIILSKKT